MRQTSWSNVVALARGASPALLAGVSEAIAKTAVQVQATAQRKFGIYQPAEGPFNAWQQLAASTVAAKARAGAEGDDPLIGHYAGASQNSQWPTPLRRSIEIAEHNPLLAEVGTNDPIGLYQELGTATIPPRPFMRPAGYEVAPEFKTEVAAVVVAVFFETGGGP